MNADKYRDNWLSGVYRHSGGSGELQVFIAGEEFQDLSVDGLFTISGKTDRGPCTLMNCFCSNVKYAHGGSVSAFYVNNILIGADVEDDDCAYFSKCTFTFENFTQWFRYIGDRRTNRKGDDIVVSIPTKVDILADTSVSGDINIKIIESCTMGYGKRSFSIKPEIRIEITSTQIKSFELFYRLICDIQGMFCLLVGKSLKPINVLLYMDDNEFETTAPDLMYAKDADFSRSIFFYTDAESIERVFKIYFTHKSACDGIIAGIREVYSHDSVNIDREIYKSMQAIEIIAREFYGERYCPDDEFDQEIAKLNTEIDKISNKKIRSRIMQSVKNSNELSLRDKCFSIIQKIEDSTSWTPHIKYKRYINKSVTMRNSITHYAKSSFDDSEFDEYIAIAAFLKKIMWAILLHNIGLTWDVVEARVLKNPFFE